MAVWYILLRLYTDLYDTGEVQAVDTTGFDRHSASRHYANRTDYTFSKDDSVSRLRNQHPVLDIHC